MKTIHILIKGVLAFMGMLLAFSCTDEGGRGTLSFSSNLKSSTTRATYDNSWDGTETVYVHLTGAMQADGTPVTEGDYDFTIDNTGLLTPPVDMYWPSTGGVEAYAWYPDYTSWSLPTDQSTKEKVQAADFVYAVATSTPLTSNSNSIKFYHQTACIVINLSEDVSVSTAEFQSVAIAVNCYSSRKPDPTTQSTTNYCAWSTETATTWVPTWRNGNTCIALVPPGTMKMSTPLLHITMTQDSGGTLETYYNIKDGDLALEAGYYYTYKVTVTNKTIMTIRGRKPTIYENTPSDFSPKV
jgi:hypothetical protein